MLKADELNQNQVNINGKWVVSRPIKNSLFFRIKDAIQVVKGKAEAVKFHDQ